MLKKGRGGGEWGRCSSREEFSVVTSSILYFTLIIPGQTLLLIPEKSNHEFVFYILLPLRLTSDINCIIS